MRKLDLFIEKLVDRTFKWFILLMMLLMFVHLVLFERERHHVNTGQAITEAFNNIEQGTGKLIPVK